MAVDAPPPLAFATDLWGNADVVDGADLPEGFEEHGVLTRNDAIVLLPLPPRRAGAAAVMRWTDGMSFTTVAARLALGVGLRTGMAAPLLKRRLGIRVASGSGSAPTLHEYLAKVFDVERVAVAGAWGPPRPNRKPVLRVFDADAQTLGFVKIGWNPLTRDLVESEARFLASAQSTRKVRIPALIHQGTWRGHSLSITEPLVGGIPRRGAVAPDAQVISEVVGLSERHREPLGSSRYRANLDERLVDIASEDLTAALDLVDRMWADREIDFGHWHGDWTPWNMNSSGSQLVVWDWERSGSPVPVGFDPLHYHFHSALAAGRPVAAALSVAAAQAGPVMRDLGVAEATISAVAMLYAIEMRTRFAAESAGVEWLDGLLETASAQFCS